MCFYEQGNSIIFNNFYRLAICHKVLSLENGHVIGDGFFEGDEVSFQCYQNYILVGEQVLKCLPTGNWNSSQPKCEGKLINNILFKENR